MRQRFVVTLQIGPQSFRIVRFHIAGCNGIDRDAVRRQFICHGLRQASDAMLAHRIAATRMPPCNDRIEPMLMMRPLQALATMWRATA